MSSTSSPTRRRLPRWPFIIVGLLALHAGLMVYAASLALGDASFAVVPDYYGKALAWDDEQQSRRDAEARGWSFSVLPSVVADAGGQRLVVARLTGRDGEPVVGAEVTLKLYHHARAADIIRVALRETAPGRHEALAPLAASGAWGVEARVVKDGEPFVFDQDVRVAGPSGL